MTCFGLHLQRVSNDVTGAKRRTDIAPDLAGPAGGYSPVAIASAYGVDPSTTTTQTVAVVDAYDDPTAVADLDVFDGQYGLPPETSASLRRYSQIGATTGLPSPDAGWAGEISLDLDAVRGLCHTCRIMLVEANSDSDTNLAAAENEAVRLGAGIVSNSFGEPETASLDPNVVAAFNHRNVVTVAGAGDDGYLSWDQYNAGTNSANAPMYPASLNTVVAVGGTTLELNDQGKRSNETVWNENGSSDLFGQLLDTPLGSTGGGCSTQSLAEPWQLHTRNYSLSECGKYRLSADVAAVADPFTGYDIYDSYDSIGWQTAGGTSLSTPLIAAMWALAGGAAGLPYPALSLYGHSTSGPPQALFDVTKGSNGFCGGDDTAICADNAGQSPNTLGFGQLDCAFEPSSATLSLGVQACTAEPGYDGPSGVGVPHGLTAFKPMNPTARIVGPTTGRQGVGLTYTASKSSDPFPGGTVFRAAWTWGDGTTSSGISAVHTYGAPGSYQVAVIVTDDYGRTSTTSSTVTIQ